MPHHDAVAGSDDHHPRDEKGEHYENSHSAPSLGKANRGPGRTRTSDLFVISEAL